MQTNLGTTPLGQLPLGALAPRKLTVDVDGQTTIGFRADGRLIVLHASRTACEVRDYGRGGKLTVLGQYAGARRIECEDVGGRLTFSIDGVCVFDAPKGRENWQPYQT